MYFDTTVFLAQIIGLFFIVTAISMLATPKMMRNIFHGAAKNRSVSYIMGLITLIIALLVVLTHTRWDSDPAKLITLLAYAVLIESLFFILSPAQLIRRYMRTMDNSKFYYGVAFGYLAFGLYLAYTGFFTPL